MTGCSNRIPKLKLLQSPKLIFSGTDSIRYYNRRSPAIQTVQEDKAIRKFSEVPMAIPSKWLSEQTMRVKKLPLTVVNLQVLEQLVQKKLDAHHIEKSTSLWNSAVLFAKKKKIWKMEKSYRSKSCQQSNSTNGLSTLWDPFSLPIIT